MNFRILKSLLFKPTLTCLNKIPPLLSITIYTAISRNNGDKIRMKMMEITGRRTVPQIFIGSTHVGGCDDLMALDSQGGLLPLLNAA